MKKIRDEKELMQFIHSWRFLLIFFLVAGILFAIGWGILVWNENRITVVDPDIIIPVDVSNYKFNLENVEWEKDDISITQDYVKISGWFVEKGQEVKKVALKIVLKDVNSDIYYVLPTDVAERTDVTEYINDGNNYDYSGFSVKIPYWEALEDTDYEIYVQYDLNDDSRVYVPLNTTVKERAKEQNNAE